MKFTALAAHIVRKAQLDGKLVRLDGALRLAPRRPAPIQPTVWR